MNEPNGPSVGRAMQNLVADLKVLSADTRELLRQTAAQSGEHLSHVRERTRDTLSAVEARLAPLQHAIAERGRHMAEVSAEHLRVHRWSTVAATAAIVFAVVAVLAWQNETTHDEDPEHDAYS